MQTWHGILCSGSNDRP